VEVDDPAACGADGVGGGCEEFQPQGLGLCDALGAGEGELLGPGDEVHGEQDDLDPDGVGRGACVGRVGPRMGRSFGAMTRIPVGQSPRPSRDVISAGPSPVAEVAAGFDGPDPYA